MEVKVCKNCRRLFNYLYGPDLCPKCMQLVSEERVSSEKKMSGSIIRPMVAEEEEKYKQVKEYIINYPKATVSQIAEVNEIPPSKIFEWIRDERLEFSDDSQSAWFECEKCGAKIKSGRLCPNCKISRK